MMPFEYYLEQNEVKKCSIDKELAKSLIKDMQSRINKSLLLDKNTFPKFIFENIYDGIRDFCDALLASEGFKSYSHKASIVYLLKINFDIPTIKELDQFRYKRNGSKYYGEIITKKEAEQIKDFYFRIKGKINKTIKDKNLQ